MEGRINTDIQSLKIIFNRNKRYIVPSVVIFVCVVLIIQIIIPQFKTMFAVREEAKNAVQKLDRLKDDLNMLKVLDEEVLELQLKTSSLALPISKDFGGILNALYFAAQRTGVSIGKFSFQIGDLGSKDAKDAKFSAINLSVALDSDIRTVNGFIDAIGKTLPLSDISFVQTDNKTSTVGLLYYYKALPDPGARKDLPVGVISQEKLSLLSKIGSFNNAVSLNLSSSSASSSVNNTNPFAP